LTSDEAVPALTGSDLEPGRHSAAPQLSVEPQPSSYADFNADTAPVFDGTPLALDEAPAVVDVGSRERVTCPECGATQDVQLNRRDAVDFCERCDFPLFWAPQRVTRDRDGSAEAESLRRLPGTVGRRTLASVQCPHCAEPNTVSAVVCVRCERSMHPVQPPPPPLVAAPPPPEPVVVEPPRETPWWVWLLVALGAVGVAILFLALTGVIF
jgi:hypothetical protein